MRRYRNIRLDNDRENSGAAVGAFAAITGVFTLCLACAALGGALGGLWYALMWGSAAYTFCACVVLVYLAVYYER